MGPQSIIGVMRSFHSHVWPKIHERTFSDIPRRYKTMEGLPEKLGVFSPFFSEDGPEKVWSRSADLVRFMAQMERNIHTHTILTGPSGSGKSTFLRRVVKPVLGEQLIFNSSYFDFISTFIDIIPTPNDLIPKRMELEQNISEFLKRPIELSINRVLQDTSLFVVPDALVKIGDQAASFIRQALAGKPTTYFVFDQIERFLSDLHHLQSKPDQAARTLSIYIVIQVLKTLRQLENTRTVFAIRADALFASIDFLTYSLDKLEDADAVFRYFYFNGINASTSPEAIEQIRVQYRTINSPVDWPAFERFTSLNSKSVSNTFLTQLSGYMLENFGASDKRVAEIVSSGECGPGDFLQIFFEHLIAGFHHSQKEFINHNIFKAVVLTIAVENRTSGDAITPQRISRLSHIPQAYVEPVVRYLLSRNVLKQEDYKATHYVRFSHDLLFDYVVEAPEFMGHDDLHKGMERLAERRIPTSDLIEVLTYGNFLDDLRQLKLPALSMLAYWLFAGLLSVSSTLQIMPLPEDWKKWIPLSQTACTMLFNVYNSVLNILPAYIRSFFLITDCSQIGYYSAAIAIMHVAWLWYIYKLDRGYFQHVFFDKPVLRRMAAALIPLGAAFGILVGFSPNLSVIPLTVVGLGMSVLLEIAARQIGPTSPFASMNRSWAIRTAMNMALTALLLVNLHSFMVSTLPAYVDARKIMQSDLFIANPTVVTFWLTSVFLCWFLAHISPEQQSAISMAARLTQFDVTRNQ
jgi:hypothetical protein